MNKTIFKIMKGHLKLSLKEMKKTKQKNNNYNFDEKR